jgi:hypothetical protein
MPFTFVQLAPINYTGDYWPRFRAMQHDAYHLIDQSCLVSTTDLGDLDSGGGPIVSPNHNHCAVLTRLLASARERAHWLPFLLVHKKACLRQEWCLERSSSIGTVIRPCGI